ncbi:MAG: hypothetical protein K2Z80_34610 [Xanthobacteraceae bacterium]|nr:hypothetical protein [Xanthobacteraceae bacterium]
MGTAMTACPATGREISAGRNIDRASFDRSPGCFGQTVCPICQTGHELFAQDAWMSWCENSVGTKSGARPSWPRRCAQAPRIAGGQTDKTTKEKGMSPAARTIVQLNIRHYRALLKTETDPTKLRTIEKLLAEEEAKLARLDSLESRKND